MTCLSETRPKAAFCGCLALLLLASSCMTADSRAADERAIRELDAQWSQTAAANDLEGTISFYSDDATLLPQTPPSPSASRRFALPGPRSSARVFPSPGR